MCLHTSCKNTCQQFFHCRWISLTQYYHNIGIASFSETNSSNFISSSLLSLLLNTNLSFIFFSYSSSLLRIIWLSLFNPIYITIEKVYFFILDTHFDLQQCSITQKRALRSIYWLKANTQFHLRYSHFSWMLICSGSLIFHFL